MRGAALLLTFALAACAPRAAAPSPGAEPAPERMTGVVRVVGSEPVNVQVVVQEPSGRSVRVDGPLAAELRRLSGVEVEVWGRPAARQGLEVAGYEVRSVDGAPVQVGGVERAPDGGLQLRTASGVVRLAGGASALKPGQKVWVQGPATVQVQSFGVIRP